MYKHITWKRAAREQLLERLDTLSTLHTTSDSFNCPYVYMCIHKHVCGHVEYCTHHFRLFKLLMRVYICIYTCVWKR